MIAPLGPLLAALLTALSAGRRRAGVRGRVGRFGGGAGLGLSAEELLLAEAQHQHASNWISAYHSLFG